MSDTADLIVRVLDDRDIVVAGAEFEVTYREKVIEEKVISGCLLPPTRCASD